MDSINGINYIEAGLQCSIFCNFRTYPRLGELIETFKDGDGITLGFDNETLKNLVKHQELRGQGLDDQSTQLLISVDRSTY